MRYKTFETLYTKYVAPILDYGSGICFFFCFLIVFFLVQRVKMIFLLQLYDSLPNKLSMEVPCDHPHKKLLNRSFKFTFTNE